MSFENPTERIEMVFWKRALDRAKALKERKLEGRDMDDFSDLYGKQGVLEDKNEIDRVEKMFEEQLNLLSETDQDDIIHSKELAECSEGIILSQSSWFGLSAETIPTTKYDDIKGGIDLIVEHKIGDAYAHDGIGIDVTYSGHNGLRRKLERLVSRAQKGQLSRVKYFSSSRNNMRGEMSQIPLVVIGCTGDTMKELTNLFAEKNDKELALHPIQFQFLEQMKVQAHTYMDIAEKSKDNNSGTDNVIKAYGDLIKRIEQIEKAKSRLYEPMKMRQRDLFHADLLESLRKISQSV